MGKACKVPFYILKTVAHTLGIVLLPCSDCRWHTSQLDRSVLRLELPQNSVFVLLISEPPLNRLSFLFIGDTERHCSDRYNGNTVYFCLGNINLAGLLTTVTEIFHGFYGFLQVNAGMMS